MRVLETAQDAGYDVDITDQCARAEVGRRTFYHWFEHAEFRQWWRDRLERFFALQLAGAYAAMGRAARGKPVPGNADRKLMFERFDKGYSPTSRQQVEHTAPCVIEVRVPDGPTPEPFRPAEDGG